MVNELARRIAEAQAKSSSSSGQDTSWADGPRAEPSPTAQGSASQQVAEAKIICLRLLAVAPRPRAGLAQALQRKGIPDDVADTVLDRLTELGWIDDVAYAQSYVRIKHRDRALGRGALRSELRKLGVDEEITTSAVQEIDSDAERSRAVELIGKRIDAAMAVGPVAARRRLLALLARRGYSAEVAVPVVEQALESYVGAAGEWS